MDSFEIGYVDGEDLKYKVFCCEAESQGEAIRLLKESQWGDFDNRYTHIKQNGEMVWEES